MLSLNELKAQYYTFGQDPASQHWRQIRTSNFRLIYPETWEDHAKELAHFLEAICEPMSLSLRSSPKPVPVILRNQTMLSNGFVMWAPKRVEMVTTIPYDNKAIDWMKYLSVHEYRHVVQVEAVNRSTTGFLTSVFGQHITGAVAGLHLPLWFLEGDAVLAETSFTRSGRGRLPSFSMPLTAQLIEKGIYSYDKAVFGSYRDVVPDHYTLGYHLVGSIQSEYGFAPFQEATKQVGTTPFLPGSFSRGIKKATGKPLSKIYDKVITALESEWISSSNIAPVSDYKIIETENMFDYVSYINPQYIDDETFIAFRTSPSDIPRLVTINRDGKENIVFTPGYGFYNSMSYVNGKAAWAEINVDPRWEYRNWTNLRILDIHTGETRLLTQKGRLQAPMLSPDGSQIAAIEVDEINNWALLIFDSETGNEVRRISDPEIDFLMEPVWADCGMAIIAVAFVEGRGKSIVKSHIDTPGFEHLFHSGFNEISEPAIHECVIYFIGSWSGRDELYAWDIDAMQLSRVLSTPFGATAASFSEDGKRILFSDYTSRGYQIAEYFTTRRQISELDEINDMSLHLYEKAVEEENILIEDISIPDLKFESKKFIKGRNQLHFHSWIPAALDIDGLMANPGLTVFSQDLLGATTLATGYEYNSLNRGHRVFLDYRFHTYYPLFDLRLEAGSEDRFYLDGENDTVIKSRTSVFDATAGISLPLSFNRNSWIFGFSPRLSTSQEIYSFNFGGEGYDRGRRSIAYRLSAYAYRRMAFMDLYPGLGISLACGFSHTPFRLREPFLDVNAGQLFYGIATAFLPGIARHHSFRVYAGWQQKVDGQTYFGDAIRIARGHEAKPNNELMLLSASYSLPLWYPDLAIGSLIYTKRLKANFFYEHSRVIYQDDINAYGSFGFDILVDAHLLRMPMPYELGFRTVYLENKRALTFEFLWGVNFYDVGQKLNFRNRMLPTY